MADRVQKWLDGKKTYLLGAVLLAYVGIETLAGREPDRAVVYGLVGAMGIALRSGVEKAKRDGGRP